MQIIDEVVDASADDGVAAPQLIDEMMTARTIQSAEAQHAGLREAGSQHGTLTTEDRIRGRRTADGRGFIHDAAVILTIDARGTGEDEALRTDGASPSQRAFHADIVSQGICFRPAAAGAGRIDDGIETTR